MIILGIESSCDETAVALINDHNHIIAEHMASHMATQEAYGGIVPEVSARLHLELLYTLTKEMLEKTSIDPKNIDAIAVTGGPGLIGGLIVGVMFAKGLAAAWNKPFIAVNHLEGHSLIIRLTHHVEFPYMLLLVSGGHSQFLLIRNIHDYLVLGETLDDSAGETFDKVARMVGLGYPGGPLIEQAATVGDCHRFTFPCPLKGRPGCDMSFSGLKSAVMRQVTLLEKNVLKYQKDLCASFQETVILILEDRTRHAIALARKSEPTITTFVLSGGVGSNQALRKRLDLLVQKDGLKFLAPPPHLCTDNGAMIAWAGLEKFRLQIQSCSDFNPLPQWSLEAMKSL